MFTLDLIEFCGQKSLRGMRGREREIEKESDMVNMREQGWIINKLEEKREISILQIFYFGVCVCVCQLEILYLENETRYINDQSNSNIPLPCSM